MIAPCTVDYLYKGAQLLDQTPDELIKNEGETPSHLYLLRAGYSLGIIVVAPVGLLYHTVAGVFNLTKSLFMSSDEESIKKEISDRGWDHLSAAGMDLVALGSMAIQALLLACVAVAIFAIYLGAYHEATVFACLIAMSLLPTYSHQENVGDLFVSYKFATKPTCFLDLLSDKREGKKPSQREIYAAHYFFDSLFQRVNEFRKEPLTDEEILAYSSLASPTYTPSSNSPMGPVFDLNAALLKHNRILPEYVAKYVMALSKKEDVEALWEQSQLEASTPKEILSYFSEHLVEIMRPT